VTVGGRDIGSADETGIQVVLSSSLEDKSFGLTNIRYFNEAIQV